MKKACVIGWPITHSRSPIIHGYWLKQLGIAGSYEKQAVEPENLAAFLSGLSASGYVGCNVTIPHKEAAYGLSQPDEIAKRLKSANTLYLKDGQLRATNTDGEGFIQSLAADVPDLKLAGKSAMVLGAGGAARALIHALLDAGVEEVTLVNRSIEKAQAIANEIGRKITVVDWDRREAALAQQSLLVNSTALGMKGQPALDISLDRLPAGAAVADIVYVPLETALIGQAKARGHRVSTGLGMLLHQAVRGFEIWFGQRPQVTAELRHLVEADVMGGH